MAVSKLLRKEAVSPLVSRKEAAVYLGVEKQTLAAWATLKRYQLQYIKVGGLAKYRLADLERFLKERTVDSAAS